MNNLQNNLDVVVISASRPKLLPYLFDSFDKYMFYHGKFNMMLHEDFVYPEESEKVIKLCEERSIKSYQHNPAEGIGNAIQFMLDKVETDYLFMLQDDWEFELPLDISKILWVMDRHPHINGVFFNKRRNMKVINGYHFKEEDYDGLRLCLSNQWPMYNGIWRTSFVRKNWKITDTSRTQESFWNRTIGLHACPLNDYEYLKKIGGYIYGPLLHPRTIRHLGYSWSVKPQGSWARQEDGYGGCIKHDFAPPNVKQRALWLPPEEERPMYLENKQDQIKELKKT